MMIQTQRLFQFRVYEGITLLLETSDLEEALQTQKNAHRKDPTKFHEIYKWHNEDICIGYFGAYQLSPHDCPECGRKPKDCRCKQKQIMNIFQLELPMVTNADKQGLWCAEASTTWHAFWDWVAVSLPDVSCPNCGSFDRYQEITDPCKDCDKPRKDRIYDENGFEDCCERLGAGYSFFVCRKCGHREFDD